MIIRLAVGYLLTLIVGYLAAGALLPRTARTALLRVSLGCGLGLALTSSLFFLWTLGFEGTHLLVIDLFACACLVIVLAQLRSERGAGVGRNEPAFIAEPFAGRAGPRPTLGARVLRVAFGAALLSSVVILISLCSAEPHGGGWDAWAIWDMQAKFMLAGKHWPRLMGQLGLWSHPSYPALLPGAVARLWVYAWGPALTAPALVAISFTLTTAGLLVGAVALCRGLDEALVAGMLLLGTPFFIRHGASEYADVPLGFFYLGSLAALALAERAASPPASATPERQGAANRLLLLAGLCAGFAAWMKSEGLLWLLALLIAEAVRGRRERLPRLARRVTIIGLGATGPLALVVVHRWLVPAHDPLLAQPATTLLAHLHNGGRYALIWRALAKYLPRTVPTLALFLVYAAARYAANRRGSATASPMMPGRSGGTAWLTIAVTLAGYLAVYLITPFDLRWHLDTSLSRLLIQLWPATLLALFLGRCTTDSWPV